MGRKYTLNEIETMLGKLGYSLKYKNHIGIHNKIEVTCLNNHLWSTTFSDIHHGKQSCPTCQGIRRFSTEEVIETFQKEGYSVTLDKYINARRKIQTLCPKGHIWAVPYFKFLSGTRCNICANNVKYKIEKIEKHVNDKGYWLISRIYKNSNSKLLMKCPNLHETMISFHEFSTRDIPCCQCHPLSLPETVLFDSIKEKYPSTKRLRECNVKIKDKPHIKGFEIDIFIPHLNKGIEFDGKYWHSYKGLRRSRGHWPDEDVLNYHEIKDKYYLSKGIKILHVREIDWIIDSKSCIDKCLLFLESH